MKGLSHTNKFNGGKLLQWKSLELELGINMVLLLTPNHEH
jgi:hypothetical protein